MPPNCTWTTFLKAAHDRETDTTKALDKIFGNPGLYGNPEYVQIAGDNYAGILGIPIHVRSYLASASYLAKEELDHIDQWPAGQREAVRAALANAVRFGQKVKFFWELYHGDHEETDIVPARGGKTPRPATITFRTPWSRVRELPAGSAQDVEVDVGS